MVSTPTLLHVISDIKKYIDVIDRNFVSRVYGKRKLYESTLAAEQSVDPECFQKFANTKEDEEKMDQCSFLFSKQVDAWHINHFWFVKPIIERQLDKLDSQIDAAQAKMVENAKKHPGRISTKV